MDESWIEKPSLYVVATPIGNLGDITDRARTALGAVDIIAAEDTRQTRKLLTHFGITPREIVAYHDHNEDKLAPLLVRRALDENLTIALVSDAGTPAVADPGYRLVAAAHAEGLAVRPIPGASALTSLVSCSGLPSDRVLFVGFLPTKKLALRTEVESWGALRASIVFYESPRRLRQTLTTIAELHPDARFVCGRELTKLHEEVISLPIAEASDWLDRTTLKGEVVVMVHPGDVKRADVDDLREEAARRLRGGETLTDVLRHYKDAGYKRSEVYPMLLAVKEELDD